MSEQQSRWPIMLIAIQALTVPAAHAQSSKVWLLASAGPGWTSSSTTERQVGFQWQADGGVQLWNRMLLGVHMLRWSGSREDPVQGRMATFTIGARLVGGLFVQGGYGAGRTVMVEFAFSETGGAFSLGASYDHAIAERWSITASFYWFRHVFSDRDFPSRMDYLTLSIGLKSIVIPFWENDDETDESSSKGARP